MALLARNLQVHPGLLHAVAEVLAVETRSLSAEQIAAYLQPASFRGMIEGNPPDVVLLTLDAAQWIGLTATDGNTWQLRESLREFRPAELDAILPRLVRRGLFDREWPSDLAEAQKHGGDLGLAIAWYLAQDAWDPPRRFEKVESSIEQRLNRQFDDRREYINDTKWVAVRRWLHYCGLGTPDPVAGEMTIPDPTRAVRDELRELEGDEWPISELLSYLATRCGVLDTGTVRVLAMSGLKADELEWEHDPQALSPSLSLALMRLEMENSLELRREADSPIDQRRTLSAGTEARVVDRVRRPRKG